MVRDSQEIKEPVLILWGPRLSGLEGKSRAEPVPQATAGLGDPGETRSRVEEQG